jgi:hypothetical protein
MSRVGGASEEPDPYAPPESRLASGSGARTRPLPVSVICVLIGLGGVAAILNMLLLLAGVGAAAPGEDLGPAIQISRNILTAGISLGFSIRLWRLDKRALPFSTAFVALVVLDNLIKWFATGPLDTWPIAFSILSGALGLGIAIAVFSYVRRLDARSRLR